MNQIKSTITSVFFSVVITSALCLHLIPQEVENTRQFKVVDVNQLTQATMKKLEEKFKDQVDLSPDMLQALAQGEAEKLFSKIASVSGGKDIVLSKSMIVYTPEHYEVTEDIANSLGLEGVKNRKFKRGNENAETVD